MIEELSGGIIALLVTATNDFSTAIAGKVYNTENPNEGSDLAYPFCVFQIIGGSNDRDSKNKYDFPTVQFSLYSDSASPLSLFQLFSKLDSVLDDSEANWSLTSYYVLSVTRVSVPRHIKNDDVWQVSADYQVKLQKKNS